MLILGDTPDEVLFLAEAFIPLPDNLGEALRSEIEADGGNGEETKGHQLDNDTDLGDVLAGVQLISRILVAVINGSDHNGTAHLKQEGNDVESDKERCDEPRRDPTQLESPSLTRHNQEQDATEDDVATSGHENWSEDY